MTYQDFAGCSHENELTLAIARLRTCLSVGARVRCLLRQRTCAGLSAANRQPRRASRARAGTKRDASSVPTPVAMS